MQTPQQKAAATRLRNRQEIAKVIRQEIAKVIRQEHEARQKKIDETKDTIAPVSYRRVIDELIEIVTCEGIEFIPLTYGGGFRNNTLIPNKSVTIVSPSFDRNFYTVRLLEGEKSRCVKFALDTNREQAFKLAADYMNGKGVGEA